MIGRAQVAHFSGCGQQLLYRIDMEDELVHSSPIQNDPSGRRTNDSGSRSAPVSQRSCFTARDGKRQPAIGIGELHELRLDEHAAAIAARDAHRHAPADGGARPTN